MDPVGGHTEVQKAWQWTFVDFGQKMSGQDGRPGGAGRGEATDCAGVGFGAIRAGGFLPVEAAGGYENGARRVLSRPRSLHPV